MNLSEQTKKALEKKRLKQIYPQVELRKKYLQKKLSQSKLEDPVLVRIQPHEKTILPHVFISLIMDKRTKISQLHSHIHKKIFKLNANFSLFLFCSKEMVTLNHGVSQLLQRNGEEDGILYLIYSDNNPF